MGGLGIGGEREGIADGAHRRDTGGEDIVHQDGGHGDKGDRRAQDMIGKRIDAAADDLVLFQNFGDFCVTVGHEAYQQTGEGDKYQAAGADKAVGLGRGVKNRGELVHQGDDGHRQPGEPQPAVLVIGEQPPAGGQEQKKPHQDQVENDEDESFHGDFLTGFKPFLLVFPLPPVFPRAKGAPGLCLPAVFPNCASPASRNPG